MSSGFGSSAHAATMAQRATWSKPALVAAYSQEAERITFPVAQAALNLSGLTITTPAAPSTARILDLCAGPGVLTFAALPFIAHSTCTDFADGMVAAAKDKASRLGDRVERKVTAEVRDCTDLSAYADSSFDAVFCLLGLFMVPTEEGRQQAVREMCRVVKPGGCVVLATWAAWNRSQLHNLMSQCSRHAMLAKKQYASRVQNGSAAPSFAPAAAAAAAEPPSAAPASSPAPTTAPAIPLSTTEEYHTLLNCAPFTSVSTSILTLPTRSYLSPTDFWHAIKSFIPTWDWASDEEERSGDEAATAWLGGLIGSHSGISPHSSVIVAVARK